MAFTDEPAVLTWMIALAPQPCRVPTGRHWWRELVTDAFRCARDAWEHQEDLVAMDYPTERREFAEKHPKPRLADFMVHLSTGAWSPEQVLS